MIDIKRQVEKRTEKGCSSWGQVEEFGATENLETEEQEYENQNNRRGFEGQEAMENKLLDQKGEGGGMPVQLSGDGGSGSGGT